MWSLAVAVVAVGLVGAAGCGRNAAATEQPSEKSAMERNSDRRIIIIVMVNFSCLYKHTRRKCATGFLARQQKIFGSEDLSSTLSACTDGGLTIHSRDEMRRVFCVMRGFAIFLCGSDFAARVGTSIN